MTDIVAVPALVLPAPFPTTADRSAGTYNSKSRAWAESEPAFGQSVVAVAQTARTNALAAKEIADDAKQVTDQNKAAAQQAKSAAEKAAAEAADSAAFYGRWSALTGPLNVPARVAHSGNDWRLMRNLASVQAAEPGVSDAWERVGGMRYTEITASQNWNTQGDRWAWLELVGGGASGGVAVGTAGNDGDASGGGGGEGYRALLDLSGYTTISVVIGAGGAKVTGTTEIAGNPGGDTSFGALIAKGGMAGGITSISAAPRAGNGLGAVGSNPEGGGSDGNAQYGGPGGGSPPGNIGTSNGGTNKYGAVGGFGIRASGVAVAGDGQGPGAGGGAAKGSTSATSGKGAPGIVRVWSWK